mgnify:CR=1 FL=1
MQDITAKQLLKILAARLVAAMDHVPPIPDAELDGIADQALEQFMGKEPVLKPDNLAILARHRDVGLDMYVNNALGSLFHKRVCEHHKQEGFTNITFG